MYFSIDFVIWMHSHASSMQKKYLLSLIIPPPSHTVSTSLLSYTYFLTPLLFSGQAWGPFWLATQWKWPWRVGAWDQVLFPSSIISIFSPSILPYPREQCLTSNKNEVGERKVKGRKDGVITYCRYMRLSSWTWEGGTFQQSELE